ncbi:MAG: hypothetical protein IH849_01325 [Acidobacteria bacterium]|nr:hypothetical protein [Acidobacteriota bacterium]
MRHAALRMFTLGLLALCLACSGDTVTPTSPALDGFATLTAEAKPASVTFNVSVTGDVDSPAGESYISNPTKLSSTQVVALGVPLNLSFFNDDEIITNGSACFSGSSDDGALAIKLEKKNTSNAVASYFFSALGKDGTAISYHLQMFGNIDGEWLPSDDTPATIALISWEMKFDTKGGKKQACTGSGDFNSTILVTHAS